MVFDIDRPAPAQLQGGDFPRRRLLGNFRKRRVELILGVLIVFNPSRSWLQQSMEKRTVISLQHDLPITLLTLMTLF